MKSTLGKGARALALLSAASLLLAGCSGGPSSDDDPADPDTSQAEGTGIVSELTDGIIRPDDGGDPTDGGILRWSAYAEPASLDPARTIFAGTTGGIEMVNLYDTLARWDADAGEYKPQTAESIEPNDDFSEWTVTLREGITFSDGTPFNAEAVKWSQERYADSPAAPEAGLWNENVENIEVVDELTLKYELQDSWRGFTAALSTGQGMIVGENSGDDDDFEPIGVGPFVLNEWTPAESISFDAREDYWGGTPHLDGFTSVFFDDQQVGIDSLESGSVEATFALQANFVEQLLEGGFNGYAAAVAGGSTALINASEGFPGHDVRVRQAINLAIDPQVLMDRAFNGAVSGEKSLFPESSQWASDVRAPEANLDEAKKLLEEAKADGYDGKIEYIDNADVASRNRALAVQAQLEAAGFEVELSLTRTIADRIKRIAQDKDYEMSAWSYNLRESDPLPRMYSNIHSTGTQTYSTYTSDEMDELIETFQAALTEEEQVEAMNGIQKLLNEDVPFVTWAQFVEVFAWADNVHGVLGHSASTVLFSDAWIE